MLTDPSSSAPLSVDNVNDGETVHQRCMIIHGRCPYFKNSDDFLSISTSDISGRTVFPQQTWPFAQGHFRALLMLTPGINHITLNHIHVSRTVGSRLFRLNYVPLLQVPPLHLAILVARDSPLLIDSLNIISRGISSAHSDLEAAIAKFRMTAYMWQAFTAEDMRSKGLDRRSFRLDEDWTLDTVSREYIQAKYEDIAYNSAMHSTAKVHIVKSDKTVSELRDAQRAQQNPHARLGQELHQFFTEALKKYGGPFNPSARPIVAGLILDSHYSMQKNMILGHAALGNSNADGISLGMFGSHLTYSWPRFMEEIASSLLDTRPPGDTVGNDNGECGTMWEACAVGQGAFMHEVGHAFGAAHTTGIMARGYSQHWPKVFLAKTAYCSHTKTVGISPITSKTVHDATWDLKDALSFSVLSHFMQPSDPIIGAKFLAATPTVSLIDIEEEEPKLALGASTGIVRIMFNDTTETSRSMPSISSTLPLVVFTAAELEERFDRAAPLKLQVLARNGRERTIANVWRLFSNTTFVRLPGSSLRLQKKSVQCDQADAPGEEWEWAVLLQRKDKNGKLVSAKSVDLRVGLVLDGAVVYWRDGHSVPCGPRWDRQGGEHHFGGHASQKLHIPAGAEITKVEVGNSDGSELAGLRMYLDNGCAAGCVNSQDVDVLEPLPGHRIVGFYGKSHWDRHFSAIKEFGIITAPVDAEIPMSAYELEELKNSDGGLGPRPGQGHRLGSEEDSEDDDEQNYNEDEEIYD